MTTFFQRILNFVASPIFLGITVCWFILQSVYIAISTNLGISPDEMYHYDLIRLFAKNGWLPIIHDQNGMYYLGEVKHVPFILYHYLLSLPYHFISNYSHQIIALRFINIGLSLVSIYLLIKLASRLKVSPLVRNLSLFMLANTLMFVFLSSSINYDSLLMPVALGSFLALFSILDKPKVSNILGLAALLMAGSLTAVNFLPILAITFIILAYKFLPHPGRLASAFATSWKQNRIKEWLLVVGCIFLSLLFVQRYVFNVVQYHTYQPSCQRVNTYEQCLQDGIFARSSLPKRVVNPRPTPLEYASTWSQSMRLDTFGIFGHKSIADNKIIRLWSEIYILIGILAIARFYRPARDWNLLLMIAFVYTAILLAQDYVGYLHSGYNFGVQGRYLFIFLPFFYFLANDAILTGLRKASLKTIFVLMSIVIFATAGLPTYIIKTTADWHTSNTVNLNQKIRNHL